MAWLLRFSHNLPKVSKRYNLRRLGKRETNESSDGLKTPSRGGCVEAANPPHSARVRRPVKSFTGSWSGTGPGALWGRARPERTTPSCQTPSGFVTITHPHHPL